MKFNRIPFGLEQSVSTSEISPHVPFGVKGPKLHAGQAWSWQESETWPLHLVCTGPFGGQWIGYGDASTDQVRLHGTAFRSSTNSARASWDGRMEGWKDGSEKTEEHGGHAIPISCGHRELCGRRSVADWLLGGFPKQRIDGQDTIMQIIQDAGCLARPCRCRCRSPPPAAMIIGGSDGRELPVRRDHRTSTPHGWSYDGTGTGTGTCRTAFSQCVTSTEDKGTFGLPSARNGVRVRHVARFLSPFATAPGAKNKPSNSLRTSPQKAPRNTRPRQNSLPEPIEHSLHPDLVVRPANFVSVSDDSVSDQVSPITAAHLYAARFAPASSQALPFIIPPIAASLGPA